MTREEAIKILSYYDVNPAFCDTHGRLLSAEEQAEAFDMAIEALQARDWIPVSERLPIKNGRYLVSYEDAVTILDFFNGKWFFPTNGNGCIAHEETDPFIRWMSLPEPYKAESEE